MDIQYKDYEKYRQVVVHKQKNKTPHQNINYNPHVIYTMQYHITTKLGYKYHVILYVSGYNNPKLHIPTAKDMDTKQGDQN